MQRYPPQPPRGADVMARLDRMEKTQIETFNMLNGRTKQIIEEMHEMKLFLRARLGAPDASKLKDIMTVRLRNERDKY